MKSEKPSVSQKSETVAKTESCPPVPKCEKVEEKEEKSTLSPEEEEEQRVYSQDKYADDRSSSDKLRECENANEELTQAHVWKNSTIDRYEEAYNQLAEENTALKSQIQALEVQLRTR